MNLEARSRPDRRKMASAGLGGKDMNTSIDIDTLKAGPELDALVSSSDGLTWG